MDEILGGCLEAVGRVAVEALFRFLFWLLSWPWRLFRRVRQDWSKDQDAGPPASRKEDKPAGHDPDFDHWPTP
jgi:hypothetical protein